MDAPSPSRATNKGRSKTRTLKCRDELWRAAKALAEANEESLSALVRRLLRRELEKQEKRGRQEGSAA